MNKPKEIDSLSKLKESPWLKIRSPSGSNEYIPKLIDLNPENLKEYPNKFKYELFFARKTNKIVFTNFFSIDISNIFYGH